MGCLIEQLQSRRIQLKLSWQELAKKVHKEISTVQKQICPSGNPSLSTLEEYAEALDSRIILVSNDAPFLSLADQAAEAKYMRKALEEKDETIHRLREQYDRLSQLVVLKDRRVEALNERVYELTKRLRELTLLSEES